MVRAKSFHCVFSTAQLLISGSQCFLSPMRRVAIV